MSIPADAPALSVVIPVYNEGPNIERTLRALAHVLPLDHEILIVHDSDDDTTLPVLERLRPQYATMRAVRNRVARGPSGALRTGFLEARGACVLVAMADLCDDFAQIPELLALVPAHADIATPSRFCAGGRQILDASIKTWAPRTAGRLLHLLTGVRTHDPTNSFKLYSAEVLNTFPLRSTVSFSVTLEVVAKAHCLGYRFAEIPTTWRDRQDGKSNFKIGRSLVTYFPWFCLMLLRNRLFALPGSWMRALLAAGPAPKNARNPLYES